MAHTSIVRRNANKQSFFFKIKVFTDKTTTLALQLIPQPQGLFFFEWNSKLQIYLVVLNPVLLIAVLKEGR